MDIILTEGTRSLTHITMGPLVIWFSYETPVAVRRGDTPVLVSQNQWGTSTGRHLNNIDGGQKNTRVPHQEVLDAIADCISVAV